MAHWQSVLKYDPLSPLLSAENDAIKFFVARDLLGKVGKNPEALWDLPEAQKIVKKQQIHTWIFEGRTTDQKSHPVVCRQPTTKRTLETSDTEKSKIRQ